MASEDGSPMLEQDGQAGQDVEAAAGAFVERLFEASVATAELMTVYLGHRLGLYATLAERGAATVDELAARAGIDRRYAREWLEQQAAAGIMEVDDAAAEADQRRFSLSAAHALALLDPASAYSMVPLVRSMVACAQALPDLSEAYRTGGGVPWSAYGPDMIEAQGDFNRPWLLSSLGATYLPAIPDLHARLTSGSPARVADVACGVGWAGIALAKAYPGARVDGFDLDASSIALARKNADAAGVADRVTFAVRDAGDAATLATYDLAVVIEAIHDLARPVEALSAIRRMLKPDGMAFIADERTADHFTAPADATERLFYAFSVLCCLPAAQADPPSVGTGTVMRLDMFRGYCEAAGFRSCTVLDLPHDMLRFYRLDP